MEDLFLTASATTPFVHFKSTGEIQISGKLIDDENSDFWDHVMKWVEAYTSSPSSLTFINLQVDYLNTSSLKRLNNFLVLITSVKSPLNKIKIIWCYNEADIYMREMGVELSAHNGIPFQMELNKEKIQLIDKAHDM